MAHIHSEIQKIDDLIQDEESTVKILEELKTRTIWDAVTGAIDIREMNIPTSEYVEEEFDEEELFDDEVEEV